ncbi:autotransporter assembly complex protein TamA [Falsiroseomonas ponticola]|uniref:autotransporter assembly complex protein TamA n=1 Tax=Falsiroseomonas ponticola TaxID=2786951 RepID=UPI001933FBF8|nr:BamA/TamA family outer membrane protein [Roseomonas ponticola]
MVRRPQPIPVLALALLLAVPLPRPGAAQEQAGIPYATTIAPSGAEGLDGPLSDASRLRRLAEEAPVDGFGLVARALAEPRLLDDVFRSEGYWAADATVLVDGQPATTPGLAERLAARAPGDPVPVEVRPNPGPRYTLRRIALRAATPAEAPAVAALGTPQGLAAGDPARSAPVLDAEADLIDRLRRAGHPLAAVVEREVVVDHEAQAMDVTWLLSPGPAARFAPPVIAGDSAVSRALVGRIAGRLEGQPYAPATQERTRRELMALGAFDSVRARAAQRLDDQGALPVTFTLADRPRNAAGFNLSYETNYGPSGSVYYERRNAFGNAERLRLEATVSRLGAGGGTEDVNSRIAANLRRPGLIDGRTTLVAEVAALRERLEAYDRDAIVASALLERPFGERWVLQTGPSLETGRIGRDGNWQEFHLAGWVLGARYDGTDNLLDPRSGIRASVTATPYADVLDGGGFVRALGTLRTYHDFTSDGGSVLALRGTLGSLVGADRAVPLDKRFYAGGGGSVRGYSYQSIGPRDARNRPDGGSSLVEGSVELRQRVSGNFGMVAFVDAGSVGQRETPSFSDVRLGAGLGVRYATAIGPVRLDVAVPLNRQEGDAGYGIYVGLGQAF